MKETEIFDKLPDYDPKQHNMVYAGIGSRQTPIKVQDIMIQIAKELEKKGYKLRSGHAKGADLAFEQGVFFTSKQEIFTASDEISKMVIDIAKEIHPNPHSINRYTNPDFIWRLMGRNTYQIFGEHLDTPVDFVLAWTPDGATSTKTRTIRTGGTGQAIDMASRKGIPVINMFNSNWRKDLDKILNL